MANKLLKNLVFKSLHLTGGRPIKTSYSGNGQIYCLHRVLGSEDKKHDKFNYIQEISAIRLEEIIKYLKQNNYDFISIDEYYSIREVKRKNPFVVFTFDDGYIDMFTQVYPLFKKYNIPFSIYITTDFVEHKMIVWWYILEEILLESKKLTFEYNGETFTYRYKNHQERYNTFLEVRNFILDSSMDEYHAKIDIIFKQYIIANKYSKIFLNWDQIEQLSNDPLVTIGSHSQSHFNLANLSNNSVLNDLIQSKQLIESKINKTINHFAYPFGSQNEFNNQTIETVKNVGFKTAVTTVMGNIMGNENMLALPRIMLCERFTKYSLNIRLSGIYQKLNS